MLLVRSVVDGRESRETDVELMSCLLMELLVVEQ